jgi:hypothetical protein
MVFYVARTPDGTFVHSGADLDAPTAWVAGCVDPGNGDVVIADAAGRVVAVVRDDGEVLRIR